MIFLEKLILLGAQLFIGFISSMFFYKQNKEINIPILSEREQNFIHYHYNKKLHYDIYLNKTFKISIYFFIFFAFSLLSLLHIAFSVIYLIYSIIFIFSEFEQLKNAKKQAFAPSYLERKKYLDIEDVQFQESLIENSENYKDDYGHYFLVDPNTFQLSSIYVISHTNFVCFYVLALIFFLSTIINLLFI